MRLSEYSFNLNVFMTNINNLAEFKLKHRKKIGGNRKIKYIEGWVEFTNKNIAKNVAYTLNNTAVGNIYIYIYIYPQEERKGIIYTGTIYGIYDIYPSLNGIT